MFTNKIVREITEGFINELIKEGFRPSRAILFGSYAKGNPQQDSDIDLAIWDKRFSGCLPIDIELLHGIKRKFPPLLEIHTFNESESVESNPFIKEIEKHGIPIKIG